MVSFFPAEDFNLSFQDSTIAHNPESIIKSRVLYGQSSSVKDGLVESYAIFDSHLTIQFFDIAGESLDLL